MSDAAYPAQQAKVPTKVRTNKKRPPRDYTPPTVTKHVLMPHVPYIHKK